MTKSIAWNTENTSALVNAYTNSGKDNEKLGEIAKSLGKTVSAVRSKLVSLGEYEKAEVARKVGGASSVRKIHLVREIEKLTGLDDLDSLEKATKESLESLLDFLAK